MKHIKNLLTEIWSYLSIRQTGKTTLLKTGIDSYDRPHWILVPTMDYGRSFILEGNKNQKIVSFKNLDKLRGSKDPLVIDHTAISTLISMTLDYINDLEIKRNDATRVSVEIAELCEMYQEDLHKMEKHILEGLRIPFWNFIKKSEYRKKSIKLIEESLEKHKVYTNKFERIKKHYGFEI